MSDPIAAEARALAEARPRKPHCVTVVAEDPAGAQVLIKFYPHEGNWHVALREESWHSWGPPLQIVEAGETQEGDW